MLLLYTTLITLFLFNVCFTRAILQPTHAKQNKTPTKTIVFLGSGGHTGEMLKIMHTYKTTLSKTSLVVFYSEENSLARFRNQFPDLKNTTFYMIGKAREVGSGKVASVKSIVYTLKTILEIIWVNRGYFLHNERTLMLLNGPGSCVLLAMLFQVIKVITLRDCHSLKIVYLESLARCNKLSMTGVFLYYLKLSDEFLVQWPEMQRSYPYAKSYGILV